MSRPLRLVTLIGLLSLALAAVIPARAQAPPPDPNEPPYSAPCPAPEPGQSIVCTCDVDNFYTDVWGTGRYSNDSNVCLAAVHAGLVQQIFRDGGIRFVGTVIVTGAEGCSFFRGSLDNEVQTYSYGAWPATFYFPEAQPGICDDPPPGGAAAYCPPTLPVEDASLTCGCGPEDMAGGGVWGSNPYTDDSSICRAALHAGIIGAEGGSVTVRRVEGAQFYGGSLQHGIQSSSFGAWPASITFE